MAFRQIWVNEVQLLKAFDNAMELLDGRLDILVQAAGVQRRHNAGGSFLLEDWEFVLDVI